MLARGADLLRTIHSSSNAASAVAPSAPLPPLITNNAAQASAAMVKLIVSVDFTRRHDITAVAPNTNAPTPMNVEKTLENPNHPVASACINRRS